MNKYLHLIFLMLLASCMGQKVSEKVSSGNINSLAPYLWNDKAFPKTIQVSKNFSDAEVLSITEMSDAWKDAIHDKNFFDYGDEIDEKSNNITNMNQLYDGEMGIYRTTIWPASLPRRALAVTQLFGRRQNIGSASELVNIEHADILVNYERFFFDTSGNGTGVGYDLRTVILHEMGHFLGMQHNESVNPEDTVMYPNISSDELKQIPQIADINDLSNKYGIYSLGAGGGSAMRGSGSNEYVVDENLPQENIKIIIELYPDGECIHREDGVQVERHHVNLK